MSVYYKPTKSHVAEAREDVNLLQMALAQMWPVAQDQRQQLIDRQMDIVMDPGLPSDVKCQAAKNVLAAGVANLKALDTIIKLGLAQAAVTATGGTRITNDAEIAEGLQGYLNDRAITQDTGRNTREAPEVSGWQLHATG